MNTLSRTLLMTLALTLGCTGVFVEAHPHDRAEHGATRQGPMARARFARAARNHPELAVAIDLRRLEMLYRKQGNEAAIVAMYQDLLKRTEQPKLREFAERRLRHAERAAHPEQAIAELRARIDRSLSELR